MKARRTIFLFPSGPNVIFTSVAKCYVMQITNEDYCHSSKLYASNIRFMSVLKYRNLHWLSHSRSLKESNDIRQNFLNDLLSSFLC